MIIDESQVRSINCFCVWLAETHVPEELFDGKVDGETITFHVWRREEEPAKQIYKGTLRGHEIEFIVTGGSPLSVYISPTQKKSTEIRGTSNDHVNRRGSPI